MKPRLSFHSSLDGDRWRCEHKDTNTGWGWTMREAYTSWARKLLSKPKSQEHKCL